MSKILARFKRAASTSSDDHPGTLISSTTETDDILSPGTLAHSSASGSITHSPIRTTHSGSHFVEEFGAGRAPPLSPIDRNSAFAGGAVGTLTPSPSKRLELPESASKGQQHPQIGTPKLVLTDPGSNSPRSFNSSPGRDSPARGEGLGLGLGVQAQEIYARPELEERRKSNLSIETTSALTPDQPDTRRRSGSVLSRLKNSPKLAPVLLDVKPDKSSRSMNKEKRSRRLSASSGKAKSIAAAIVGKTGHNVTGSFEDAQSKRHSMRSTHTAEYDYEDEEEDSGSELDDDLPVTGFAVASNRRNADFHAMFPSVDEGDYLIEDYGCALSKDILVQGRLYVSENHICFHANIFGWVTDLVIPFADIRLVEKKMTALVIPNAIGISTGRDKYTFASFISRDTTFDVMMNIWRLCNPNAVMSTASLIHSRPASIAGTDVDSPPDTGGGQGHAPTTCACGKEGKHYSEIALETTLASTPEKVYNLMFASEWIKTFLTENQKLRELEMSDWKPLAGKLLARSMTYIKPLNGSIGPKQTKCHIIDEQDHFDLDSYISMITTTRTPDVPSGGVFSVKTRTCLMWAGGNSTKVVVTSTVEWTGKSWVKGIIEKSAIDGQKQYHSDLVKGMRAYMKQHPTEFGTGDGPTSDELGEEGHEKPSEAEAYAAENRKKRQRDDLGYIQGGLDRIVSGLGSIGSGLVAVLQSLGDLVANLPLSKEVILGSLVLLLVISNVYTYLAFRSQAPTRQARRLGRENDLSEVVRLLLEKGSTKVNGKTHEGGDPANEVADLVRLLDGVEKRAARLKSAVGGGTAGEVRHDSLD